VNRHPGLGGIVHGLVLEPNPAGAVVVGKSEVVKRLETASHLELSLAAPFEHLEGCGAIRVLGERLRE
jgi:hypothetical protein